MCSPQNTCTRRRLKELWREKHPVSADDDLNLPLSSGRFLPHEAPHAVRRLRETARGKIAATLDENLQKQTEAILSKYVKDNAGRGIFNAAAILVDYKTAEVLAAVGSADFFNEKIDGQVDGTAALRYLIPVLLFIAGVFLSELCLHLAKKKREEFRGHGFVLLGEIAVLVAVGFLPPSVPDMLVNALVSLAAAVQFDNFRKMEGKPFATAFCTGNMRTATEHAMHAAAERDRAAAKVTAKYALLICAFLCGVLAGYYASQAAGGYAAFIAAAILAAVFAGILLGERARRRLEEQQTERAEPSA